MKISNECYIIPSLWSSSNLGMTCNDYQEIKVPSPSTICYHSSLNTLMLLFKAKYQWLGSRKGNISSWLTKIFTSMLPTSHIGCLQLFWSSNISPACLLQWKGDKSLVFVLYLSELLVNECCMSSSFPLSLLELPLEYQSEIIVQSFQNNK